MKSTNDNTLNSVTNSYYPLLKRIEENNLRNKPYPERWSKIEILGHLIDSAITNHRRFILGQIEINPMVTYDQDLFCALNCYQKADSNQLIELWYYLNKQLVFLWQNMPEHSNSRLANHHTLAYLKEDYINHLVHHLDQILLK